MRSFCEIGCEKGTDKCAHHGYHVWYESHFNILRNKPITLVEIGVLKGASLRLWEEFFPQAKIYGIDCNPECTKLESDRSKVFIGDQTDTTFLSKMADQVGEIDILIDDGGHMMDQQTTSFKALFNRIRIGGYYVVEDLESSYQTMYNGGPVGQPGTMISLIKSLADDIHGMFHWNSPNAPARISEIHLYKNIVFLRRA